MSIRFAEAITVRAPVGLANAISSAAKRDHTSASEWLRQALLRELRNQGIHLGIDGRIEEIEPARSAR